jgi:leader peptidase (prepilin peptidase)/N-methyltransferase
MLDPNNPELMWHMLFLVYFATMLSVVAVHDIRTKTIPNAVVMALIPLVIMSCFLYPELTGVSRLIGIFIASGPMLLMTVAWPGAFGGGDIKLMAIVGMILGWQLTLLAFVIASLLGFFQTIVLLVLKKTTLKGTLPFGPALSIGTLIAFISGDEIMTTLLVLAMTSAQTSII